MKKTCRILGMVIFAMIIGFVFASCDMGGDDKGGSTLPDTSGSITITGFPSEYNGMYVFGYGEVYVNNESKDFFAGESQSDYSTTGSKISNGTATLKVWEEIYIEETDREDYIAYNGNDEGVSFDLEITSSSTITYSNYMTAYLASAELSSVDFEDGKGEGTVLYVVPVVHVDLGGGVKGTMELYSSYIELSTDEHAFEITGEEADYINDFTIFVEGTQISSNEYNLYIDSEGYIEFSLFGESFTGGQTYEIEIAYTANASRPIKAWIPDWNEYEEGDPAPSNAITLKSFNITKDIVAD